MLSKHLKRNIFTDEHKTYNKMNHKILFTLFGLFCCNIITDIAAQTFEKRGFPQERLSPELTARKKTEQMDKLLQLSEKQFKKNIQTKFERGKIDRCPTKKQTRNNASSYA